LRPTKTFEENLKAYRDGFRTIVNKGSARSGKTVGIIQVYDFIATYSRKHRKLSITSQSFPHLREGAIYEYKKHQMREDIKRKHNKSSHEFLVNQSIINYFSLDDPAKAIGPGRDICYINECNKGINYESYNNLLTRTTECMFLDYNPSGEFWLHEQKILDDDRTKLIHSTWLDNIENLTKQQINDFIDAKRKSKISDYWNYYWKVYGLGEDAVLLEETNNADG
jgi:phage terminase large subunit